MSLSRMKRNGIYMMKNDSKTGKGSPLPLGSTWHQNGINFALIAKHATSVTLVLYDINEVLIAEIELDPFFNKTGDVWHIFVVADISQPLIYGFKLDGSLVEPQKHYYRPHKSMLDPYAKAIHSSQAWANICLGDKEAYHPLGLILPPIEFDWESDKPPLTLDKDLVIYEMHVRGFTKDPSSQVKTTPGTFAAVIEKIPHLLELGVNAVELMPIQEFNECEYQVLNPHIHEKLYQYWGYSTVNFFAPMNRYASTPEPGVAILEFKSMVKALHQNEISVILDVVFNHTNEGDENGPINSFKGIDCCTYYLLDKNGQFMNFTGCGNTFNTNYPVVQNLIIDVLRYWVLEMHVDGFRFDLASVFSLGTNGEVLPLAPIIEAISHDPVLSKTLLIAEPWDATGLYQVGNFHPHEVRWSEWNDRYRDTVRSFIKGDVNNKGKFASRIAGSQDMYGFRSPTSSINFIVAHDGFTLNDLVSYNQKHNLQNGENNNDGTNNNESWNCGKEGPSQDPKVNELRNRQKRNLHLALMISQGIPMLLMGDEYSHTKKGNNNTWCHDNELNWFLWHKLEENTGFYRYYRKLIEFRKLHPILHQGRFLTDDDVTWLGINGQKTSWDKDPHFLAFLLKDKDHSHDLYCAFNAQNIAVNIQLPLTRNHQNWHEVVYTANEPPEDFYDKGQEPIVKDQFFPMKPFSALLLEAS